MLSPLALLAVLLGLWSGPSVQGCRRCDDTGIVRCRRCARDACVARRPFLACTVAAACEECGGAQRVDCKECDAEPQVDLEARRAAMQALVERMRPVDAFMQEPLAHCESASFRLTWDIERIDVGKPHQAMHVYLDRLEDLMEALQRDLGATAEDFSAPTWVLLWDSRRMQERASLEYTRQPSTTESKLMGAAPVVSIYYDKGHLHEEPELHQAVVHQVAHCLLSNAWDGVWPGNINAGWIDEGLAHWYETSLFGGVRHYCYVENDTLMDFKYGRWEPEVRVAVDRDENLGVLSVTGRNTVDMTPQERMYAWSLVDYLLRARPGTLGPIARDLKARRPLKDTLAERLELNPFELEQAWETWVQATYSPKKRPR